MTLLLYDQNIYFKSNTRFKTIQSYLHFLLLIVQGEFGCRLNYEIFNILIGIVL